MDGAVPMVVVAEGARPAILRAIAVEPSEAVVALNSVGRDTRWGRSDGLSADARHVLVVGRGVIFRSSVV